MKYEVKQHLTYVDSVVVEADNKVKANEKALEFGEMSKRGKNIDIYVSKIEIKEVNDG
tara:strand:+ start:197 stop:370 length:174 start_codon:yes stop_codon:yes gene_type:complete